MPTSNEKLATSASTFKREASREFDKAVRALIELAWSKGKPDGNFLWENNPELDAEANRILTGLSDRLVEKAKRIAVDIIREQFTNADAEAAWEQVDGEDEETPLIARFDMQGSHLKELLEIWIALAAVNGIAKSELRVLISRYINNPSASPLWAGLPKDILKWGRGYSKNIMDQMAVIGQNAIIGATRYAEWYDAMENGAEYYVRHRGSNYDCPDCDDLCGYPIPITTPFLFLHSRCMCYPEYFFGQEP